MGRRRKNTGGTKNHNNAPPQPSVRYHGLINQGATCYLNSVLQLLFMTTEFREAVSSAANCKHQWIDHQLKSLFDRLKRETASTQSITNHLGIMKVFEQRDAAECFEKILNHTSSDASQIFQGELTQHSKCSKCERETKSDAPFWSIPLTLVDSESEVYSVMDGIQSYFQESHIGGDNQLYCDCCKDKTDATINLEMKTRPKVLTLLLKRFKFDYQNIKYIKKKSKVQIPTTLQIPPNGVQSLTYELYAYVDHVGELSQGHYTVTVKSQDNNKWYNFSDAHVKLGDFRKQSQSAYLLFYRKVSSTEVPKEDLSELSTSKGCMQTTSDAMAKEVEKTENHHKVDKKETRKGLSKGDNESQKHHECQEQSLIVQVQDGAKLDNVGQTRCKKQEEIQKPYNPGPTQGNEAIMNKQITSNNMNGVCENQIINQSQDLDFRKDGNEKLDTNQPTNSSVKSRKKRGRRKHTKGQQRSEDHHSQSQMGQEHHLLEDAPQNGLKQDEQQQVEHEDVGSEKDQKQKMDNRNVRDEESRRNDEHFNKCLKRKHTGCTGDDLITNESQDQRSRDEFQTDNQDTTWDEGMKKVKTEGGFVWQNREDEYLLNNLNVELKSKGENEDKLKQSEEEKVNTEWNNRDHDEHDQTTQSSENHSNSEMNQKSVQLDIRPNRLQDGLDQDQNTMLTLETADKDSDARCDSKTDEMDSLLKNFDKLSVKDSSKPQGCINDNTSGTIDCSSETHALTDSNPEKIPQPSLNAHMEANRQ